MRGAQHLTETDVALYAAGDLPLWRRPLTRLHASGCAACTERIAAYRSDQEFVRRMAAELPCGLNWDRLAAEMTANIRVGLEAGECVARRTQPRTLSTGWRVAAASAGFAALLVSAWWLNMPASQTASLGRAVKKIAQASPWRGGPILPLEDQGPLVEVSAAGIQLRENGGALGVSQGLARPVSVTLSAQGSARARYLDQETGQVTITSVYAQ
jgi:anti-sigma factor RsiW